ncbi:MAG: SCO family protein, partial [Calditrichaeota bacterium]
MLRRTNCLGFLVAFAAVLLFQFAGCRSDASFKGTELGVDIPFMDFTLTDQHNQRFQLRDHLGKVVVLFFGYT